MQYRARNIRTEEVVLCDDTFIVTNEDPEWVLEFEIVDEEWRSSSFHRKDINGVIDPRPFTEIHFALREISA